MPEFRDYLANCWVTCFGLWTAILRGDLSCHKTPQHIQALDTLSFPQDRTDGAVEQVNNN